MVLAHTAIHTAAIHTAAALDRLHSLGTKAREVAARPRTAAVPQCVSISEGPGAKSSQLKHGTALWT
jgi:hypothetical protein